MTGMAERPMPGAYALDVHTSTVALARQPRGRAANTAHGPATERRFCSLSL